MCPAKRRSGKNVPMTSVAFSSKVAKKNLYLEYSTNDATTVKANSLRGSREGTINFRFVFHPLNNWNKFRD